MQLARGLAGDRGRDPQGFTGYKYWRDNLLRDVLLIQASFEAYAQSPFPIFPYHIIIFTTQHVEVRLLLPSLPHPITADSDIPSPLSPLSAQIAGGYKATLSNDRTSDEAKQNAREQLDRMEEAGAIDHQEKTTNISEKPQEKKNKNNVIGGHKANLSVSEALSMAHLCVEYNAEANDSLDAQNPQTSEGEVLLLNLTRRHYGEFAY